jgi:hypothetical protein
MFTPYSYQYVRQPRLLKRRASIAAEFHSNPRSKSSLFNYVSKLELRNKIWGLDTQSGEYKESYILGFDTIWSGEILQDYTALRLVG